MPSTTSCSASWSRSTVNSADRRSGHRELASVHLRGRDGYPPGPTMSVPAREPEPLSLDEVKEQLVVKGRERGFVTSEDLLEAVPVDDFTQEQVEEFLTAIQEHLTAEAVEVIEVPGDDTDAATQVRIEVDLLRAPTNDPVRMYLKEIGKVPLLNAAQEVDLARRIQAGELSTALQRQVGEDGKPDPKELKFMVEKVWEIRDHQLNAFGKVEGIGRDKIAKSYRPKTEPELHDFCRRVERDGQLAKRKLIEANLRLVVSIAKRYVGRGMLFLDLIQEGNLGLIRAVEKFDYSKGYKFSTYATWWIRQAITRAIADQARTIRIPVHMVESINKVHRVQRQMLQELEREPTVEELADKVGMTVARVREIMRISQDPLSLDSPVGEEDDSNLADFLADAQAEAPAEIAAKMMLNSAVLEALGELNEREQQVVRLRFGLEDGQARTLEEVGKEFGVTRERIRQIESKTLAKLRHPHRSQKLRDYLDGE